MERAQRGEAGQEAPLPGEVAGVEPFSGKALSSLPGPVVVVYARAAKRLQYLSSPALSFFRALGAISSAIAVSSQGQGEGGLFAYQRIAGWWCGRTPGDEELVCIAQSRKDFDEN